MARNTLTLSKPRAPEMVCRSFRREFPEFVADITALGLRVTASPGRRVNGLPTFWLDGHYQLTGYETNADGLAFTGEDAAKHIEQIVQDINAGRAEVAAETREQRFVRVIDGMKTIELRSRFFCGYRHPSGDHGSIFYRHGCPVDAWVGFWNEKHVASVRDMPLDRLYDALNASFSRGGESVSGKTFLITEAA
jgi:hypothetical protein